jgi:hypothetical protein
VNLCRTIAPTLVIPGNHDVRWWASPFGLRGEGPKYRHYRRYFGEVLGPVLTVPGAVMVGLVSAHGLAPGSVTWKPRDLTVKGHLESELARRPPSRRRCPRLAGRRAHHLCWRDRSPTGGLA